MPETTNAHGTTPRLHESPPVAGDAAVAVASLHAMGTGTLNDFEALYTADAVNREAITEPPDTRGTGPAAFYAALCDGRSCVRSQGHRSWAVIQRK